MYRPKVLGVQSTQRNYLTDRIISLEISERDALQSNIIITWKNYPVTSSFVDCILLIYRKWGYFSDLVILGVVNKVQQKIDEITR